jgi:hypothetical protein
MRGFEKKFFDPASVPMHFFEVAPGQTRVIKNIFFAGFPFFTSN